MKKIFLTALVFAASCSEWPRTELEREVTIKDNYTLIDTATVTTTTDLDHVTNNETINPKVIIQPKSIIGFIPLKTKDRNAHMVVRTV